MTQAGLAVAERGFEALLALLRAQFLIMLPRADERRDERRDESQSAAGVSKDDA